MTGPIQGATNASVTGNAWGKGLDDRRGEDRRRS